MNISIKPYVAADRDACIAVLRSNTPEHFLARDEHDFAQFLDKLPGPYFVVREAETVVSCGGIALNSDRISAALCWGMVAAHKHRCGIGSVLLEHRKCEFLSVHPNVGALTIHTTQKVEAFYARHGFVVNQRKVDGYGPGLDHVEMRCALSK